MPEKRRMSVCPTCQGVKDSRSKNCKACKIPAPRTAEWNSNISKGWNPKSAHPGRKQSEEEISKRMISRWGYDTTKVEKTYDSKNTRWHLIKWAKEVKESWNNKCASCSSTKKLEAHHIMAKALFPELETLVTNGICLCHNCHWDLHRHIGGV
jgi:predicted restriction endonuclease